MSSTAPYRRGEVLRRVEEAANSRLDGALPTDVPGVAETFRDDLELVGALQIRWHTVMAATLERALDDDALEDSAGSLEQVVLTAWHDAATELAGLRRVLDAYAENPTSAELGEALDVANRKDRALLALMAGLSNGQDAAAAEVGRSLELRARTLAA